MNYKQKQCQVETAEGSALEGERSIVVVQWSKVIYQQVDA